MRLGRASAALVVAAGTLVLPAAAGAPGASCAAAGQIRVNVVVDFGDGRGATPVCVPMDGGASGAVALARRAEVLGTPPPRWDNGFLCAIDGVPDHGCGNQPGGGDYWAYWHGEDGKWTYSNVGAATWKLRDGDVEGWRFLHDANEHNASPPRANPTPCPAPAPATTAPTATAPTATTAITATRRATGSATAVAPTSAPPASPPTSASPTLPTTTTAPDTRVTLAAGRPTSSDRASPVGPLVVGAAVVALAVAAGLRFRGRAS